MGLVSVIIPTYNRASLVTEAMDSVWEQTYRPIECVVVDDGSTDDTIEIVADWKQEHEADKFSVRLIRQENKGAPAARNHGMKKASGDFLLFLDSDDLLTPRAIKKLHQCLIDSGADVAYGDVVVVQGGKEEKQSQRPPSTSHVVSMLNGAPETSSALLKRQTTDEVRWREELSCAQEFGFFLDLALSGTNFSHIQSVVLRARVVAEERISSSGYYAMAIGKVLLDVEKKFRRQDEFENRKYDRSLVYISNLLSRMGNLDESKKLLKKANKKRVLWGLKENWSVHVFISLAIGPKMSQKLYQIKNYLNQKK